jgi:hypothetical protein
LIQPPYPLPGYLIKVQAELKIDGEVVQSGGYFSLGQELSTASAITTAPGMWLPAYDKPIAGEFYAIGIDSQGISAKQLETVKTRMETTKTQLETKQFDGITKDALIGDMLYTGVLSYFAANDINLKMVNHGGKALSYRLPSFGTFSTSLKPNYFFGIPQRVKMEGIRVNIDFLNKSLWAVDNDRATTIAITQQIGIMASSLEQRIPELLFTDPDDEQPASGVSAVHALMTAVQEGQQIYQVTPENVDVILPSLNVRADVKDDIRAGAAAGKITTISQNQVTVGDWVGVGYIITDPRTGTGAYLISCGYNGALEQLAAHFSGAINVFSLIGMLSQVGLGALAPLWDNIFEYLKCSGVDQLIKEAIMAILTAVMIVLILAAATRFKTPGALAPLIRLAMSLLTVLSNRVAMAVGPKTKCGSPNLKLISIHFSANDPQKFLPIKKDQPSGITLIPIDQPQWKKSQSQPLAYVADGYKTFMKMTAKFKVNRAPKKPMTVKIKTRVSIGNANQNLKARTPTFPEDSLTLKYGDLEKTSEFQQSNFLTLNLTQFFDPMKIDWKFSYKGNRTKTIGTSKHKVYITRDKPVDRDSVFLTLLHLATSNPGAFSQAEVVEKTWELFKKPIGGIPSVKAWNGDKFIYYPEERGFNDFLIRDAEDFLKQRVGPCAPFAALLANSLRINNLTVEYAAVQTKDNSRFMIDNWDFEKQSFPKEDRFQFYLTDEGGGEHGMVPHPSSYGDLVNKPGLPGQNTQTPSEKVFRKHYIVDLSSVSGLKGHRYYDPSYGITFKDADHFEREVVFGYAYKGDRTDSGDISYQVQQVIPTLYPRNIKFETYD